MVAANSGCVKSIDPLIYSIYPRNRLLLPGLQVPRILPLDFLETTLYIRVNQTAGVLLWLIATVLPEAVWLNYSLIFD